MASPLFPPGARRGPLPPLPPPPPPPPPQQSPSSVSKVGPPPPPPPPPPAPPLQSPSSFSMVPAQIPEQYKQFPREKSKTTRLLQLVPIPFAAIQQGENIWNSKVNMIGNAEYFEALEEEFATDAFASVSPKLSRSSSMSSISSIQSKSFKIQLLDHKRLLNVSLKLRQFTGKTAKEIVNLVVKGVVEELTPERINALMDCLPSDEEKAIFRNYTGDPSQLEFAEEYLYLVCHDDAYATRLELLDFVSGFEDKINEISDASKCIIQGAKALRQSRSLRNFFRLLLDTGNYLNMGSSKGVACGFRISAMKNVLETKTKTPGVTLIHFVADKAEQLDPTLLDFVKELEILATASTRKMIIQITEFKQLKDTINEIETKISRMEDRDFVISAKKYFQKANAELSTVESLFEEAGKLETELKIYFLEASKNIDELLEFFNWFVQSVVDAQKANEKRRVLAEKEAKRQSQIQTQQSMRKESTSPSSKSAAESDLQTLMEQLMSETASERTPAPRKGGRRRLFKDGDLDRERTG